MNERERLLGLTRTLAVRFVCAQRVTDRSVDSRTSAFAVAGATANAVATSAMAGSQTLISR